MKRPKTFEFAVQLFPDLTRLTLNIQGSCTVFTGHPPPRHHNHTAIHAYLASIDPANGNKFADAWLDIFHITLGSLHMPLGSVAEFEQLMRAAAGKLPSLSDLQYTSSDLQYSTKEGRLKADIKGIHFYHLGLRANEEQLTAVLQPWITAVQKVTAKLRLNFEIHSFSEHHITLRSHHKAKFSEVRLRQLQRTVQHSPVTFQIAGLRVQLCASLAEELYGKTHTRTHLCPGGSEVRYPVPAFASCEAASAAIERVHSQACTNGVSAGHAEKTTLSGKLCIIHVCWDQAACMGLHVLLKCVSHEVTLCIAWQQICLQTACSYEPEAAHCVRTEIRAKGNHIC